MPNGKYWCATFFMEPSKKGIESCRYMIIGKETCPTTKKLHYQCYMEYQKNQSMIDIKKSFRDKTIHLEQRKGTAEAAITYCKKERNFTEYGIKCTQGTRVDLLTIKHRMEAGERLDELMCDDKAAHTCAKFLKYFEKYQGILDYKNSLEFRPLEVELITGPTNTNKTRSAIESNGGPHAVFKQHGEDMKWWNGYNGQKIMILDEYNNDTSITNLLGLLDGYQKRLEIKGSHTFANWTKVIITTNRKLEEIHPQALPAHRDALFRRIHKITNLWIDGHPSGAKGTDSAS